MTTSEISLSASIGAIDAYKDEDVLFKCFVPVDYVDQLKKSENYFLVGRRGSGKSACILKLYREDPGHKVLITWERTPKGPRMDFFSIFMRQLSSLRDQTYQAIWSYIKVEHLLMPVWQYLIRIAMMQEVVRRHGKDEIIVPIDEFLRSRGFAGRSPFQVFETLIKNLASFHALDSRAEEIYSVISILDEELQQPRFRRASEHLDKFLRQLDGTFTIYIDALIDRVIKRDDLLADTVLSLMRAIYEVQPFNTPDNVRIKCTIPGEVLERLEYFDIIKLKDRCVFTHWSPKDLKRLIEARLLLLLTTVRPSFAANPTRDAWAEVFPPKITNLKGLPETSFYYLCRHSHHYPREIIMATKELLRWAESVSLLGRMPSKEFVKAIHRASSQMASEFFDRNRTSFPDLTKVINEFHGRNRIIPHSEVYKILRPFGKRSEADEWITLLIQAGFLGVVTNFEDTTSRVLEAKFAFITRQIPRFNENSHFAIHPMFFDMLDIRRDGNRYILPESYREEDEDGE